jgi:two-component system sensor histidine kinase DegS
MILEINYQPNQIALIIHDNGVGFHSEKMEQEAGRNGHFGLVGMRERIELIEGRMEIDSNPGQGTKIMMQIPTTTAESRKE